MTTPTMSATVLRSRMENYLKKYPPDTGYTRRVVNEVLAADLPAGTNIGVQIALQYDGATAGGDLVANTEKQLPYAYTYSLDVASDCLVFVRNVIDLLFGRSIGTYTEDAYLKNVDRQVPWADRQPMDLFLWKFSDRNPHATHAALCIGNGKMLHTTSASNPLRVEADTTYSAASRAGTGCFRVLTTAENESLTVQTGAEEDDMTNEQADKLIAAVEALSATTKHLDNTVSQLQYIGVMGVRLAAGREELALSANTQYGERWKGQTTPL